MKKTEKLIAAFLGLGLFGAIAIGSTLALYQTEKTVNNHLKSGGMDASFYLLSIKNDRLNDDGSITKDVEAELEEYSGYTENISYYDEDDAAENTVNGVDLEIYDEEVFSVEYVVPTMKGSATFLIVNEAAADAVDSVAFNFDLALEDEEGDAELIEQIDVELDHADWDGNLLKSGKGRKFTVTWEFIDSEDNNDAMNQSLTFDISLTCTQVTRD